MNNEQKIMVNPHNEDKHKEVTQCKTVSFITLGCKVNQYESDGMALMLKKAGYQIVESHEPADITIINTCAVTNIAQRKSRQMMSRAKKQNPNTLLVAAGCYIQNIEKELDQLPEVDLFLGNNQKKEIVKFLDEYFAVKECQSHIIDINHTSEYEEFQVSATTEHARAYVKIQDGCNQFCSYCIIPYVRGRVRSRALAEIVEEGRQLATSGYKELVLTGIHISSYGVDIADDNCNFLTLLQALHAIEGIERIRLGSLEPGIITENFAKEIVKLKKVCPHFHLSLQSGCDATLKRMNRKYTTAEYAKKCDILREVYDKPAITTDVIVGFPGETDDEFRQTKDYLEKLNLYEMHIFKYSIRNGTVAADMAGQINGTVKHQRSEILLAMAAEHKMEYENHFIGCREQVLVEEQIEMNGKLYWVGHTTRYVKVAIAIEEFVVSGDIIDVTIVGRINEMYLEGQAYKL